MQQKISIGKQNFADMRENKYFLIDKTDFIKEWWDSGDDVTLITRPRRFGKTLNMSMLECFFSNRYAGRGDLFEGLSVWEDEAYRQIQGTYPVIFLSFADVKADNIQDAKRQVKMKVAELFDQNSYLLDNYMLGNNGRDTFDKITIGMDDTLCSHAVNIMCRYMQHYYNKKVIVLLDEYDTPMQESYIYGYENEFTAFLRSFFIATFKTNPYLECVMTMRIDSSSGEPERFYHGFVLGLMVEQAERYEVRSNRESGFGRYDVMLIPKKDNLPAIVMEFKVRNPGREQTLEATAQSALNQIEDKNYDAELVARGIPCERIRHYGLAFEGKRVLIME